MRFVPITEARRDLPSLVDSRDVHAISRQGRPVAVLMSYDAYRAMQADLELLRDPEGLLAIERDHRRFMTGVPQLPAYDPETGRLDVERTPAARDDVGAQVRETLEEFHDMITRMEAELDALKQSAAAELPRE